MRRARVSCDDHLTQQRDIDGGLILNSGIITPKDKISAIAKSLAQSRTKTSLKTQFNLLDRATNKDSRFLSYSTDYTEWLKSRAKVIFGPNYLQEFNGIDFKSGVLSSCAFNLRKVRNNLLYSEVYLSNNPKEFQKRVENSIEISAKYPKKLLYLRKGKVVPSRNESKERLEKILENVDLSFIDTADALLKSPAELYQELKDEDKALKLLTQSLESIEQMISSYISNFPYISNLESRDYYRHCINFKRFFHR